MIGGVVNAYHEATIRLPVQAAGGQRREIETILDTGFNGSLTLPPDLIADLGLSWRTRGLVLLANGAQEPCDIYAATIIWDGKPRRILVEAADTDPLVGMGLLYRHDVRMQVVAGGAVMIEALS
ncbi:MAG: clan AA aspartic protease [Chloroflexi bacterium]|nr:clan AA aspartic protease [Chloroflexota bacterium]